MTAQLSQRRALPPFPKRMTEELVAFSALVWAGFAAFIFVLTFVVSALREDGIEVSGWDQGAQAAMWFAGGVVGWVGWQQLQLYVTHGRTRRDFWWQIVMFVPFYAATLALMVTVTFALEAGLYSLMDWPQEVGDDKLFSSARELHLIFLHYWLVLTLWGAGGFFIGAGFYRSDGLGSLAVIVCIVFAGISGIALTGDWGPFGAVYMFLFGEDSIGGALGVGIHLVLIALLAAMDWRVVRDIPIRNKTS